MGIFGTDEFFYQHNAIFHSHACTRGQLWRCGVRRITDQRHGTLVPRLMEQMRLKRTVNNGGMLVECLTDLSQFTAKLIQQIFQNHMQLNCIAFLMVRNSLQQEQIHLLRRNWRESNLDRTTEIKEPVVYMARSWQHHTPTGLAGEAWPIAGGIERGSA